MIFRIIGLVVLVVGVVLLVMGINQAQSFSEGLREDITGEYSDDTQWYIIGGIAAIVGGGALALLGGRIGGGKRKPT
jgi:hypothetical protein